MFLPQKPFKWLKKESNDKLSKDLKEESFYNRSYSNMSKVNCKYLNSSHRKKYVV